MVWGLPEKFAHSKKEEEVLIEKNQISAYICLFILYNTRYILLYCRTILRARAKSVFSKKRLFVLLIKLFFIPLHSDAGDKPQRRCWHDFMENN